MMMMKKVNETMQMLRCARTEHYTKQFTQLQTHSTHTHPNNNNNYDIAYKIYGRCFLLYLGSSL